MTDNQTLFNQAQQFIPGGVNSPVRAFKGVGGEPVFIDHAKGAYLYASDNTRYIDYVASWGPMIVGHSHPQVLAAVQQTLTKGLSFGAPTELETQMAEKLCQYVPSLDLVRMVNSGTEATMSAIRLARGYTGRDKILKFEGCYHGHSDSLLVKAGSGALTLGVPSSPGVPASLAEHTITASFNDLEEVTKIFQQQGEQIAGMIVEPVAGNMNCVPPVAGFLEGLRALCDQYQSVLIFDEVMTGFRVALGGAQSYYNITPDLTTLGKVVGGGMPVGAFGGKREIMEQIAPLGPVYQAGTLSGNPIAMSAGLATLALISQANFYQDLTKKTNYLVEGFARLAKQHNIPFSSNAVGGMFGLFFSDDTNITNFQQVSLCHVERFKQFFHKMLAQGVYLAPSAYEAGFVSASHSYDDLDQTIAIADKVLAEL